MFVRLEHFNKLFYVIKNMPLVGTDETVRISDGGNAITVDGTVAVSGVSGTTTVDGTVNVTVARSSALLYNDVTLNAYTDSSVIDMDGFNHLHLFGSTTTSSAQVYLKFSHNNSDYFLSYKSFNPMSIASSGTNQFELLVENVGARYIKLYSTHTLNNFKCVYSLLGTKPASGE